VATKIGCSLFQREEKTRLHHTVKFPERCMSQSCILCVGVVLNTVCYLLSFSIPWAIVRIHVNKGDYELMVPVTLGIYGCYSDPCLYDSQYFVMNGEEMEFDVATRDNFLWIRGFVLLTYTLGTVMGIISLLCRSFILCYCSNCGCIRYMYPISVTMLVMSCVMYFAFMYQYFVNSGMLEGSILLLTSATFGMVFSAMYLSELSLERYRYSRIPDVPVQYA
jgi:hypothetical protein